MLNCREQVIAVEYNPMLTYLNFAATEKHWQRHRRSSGLFWLAMTEYLFLFAAPDLKKKIHFKAAFNDILSVIRDFRVRLGALNGWPTISSVERQETFLIS